MTTLTDALRKAALDRAHATGNIFDRYLLGPDGVIDLRQLQAEIVYEAPRTVPMLPTLGITEGFLDLRGTSARPKGRIRRSRHANTAQN